MLFGVDKKPLSYLLRPPTPFIGGLQGEADTPMPPSTRSGPKLIFKMQNRGRGPASPPLALQ